MKSLISLVIMLFVQAVFAQSLTSDCPGILGNREYGDSTIREYFCGEFDRGYKCIFYAEGMTMHRDSINPAYLTECTTTFCRVTSHILYLQQGNYNPAFEQVCTTHTSAGDVDSKVTTTESQCRPGKSHVVVDTLSLEEQVPVSGVPFFLNYSSSKYKIGFETLPTALGLGGWTVSIIHNYDLGRRVLYYGDGGQWPTSRQPTLSNSGATYIPSESGSQLFYIDGTGRHYKTVDALTGATIYQFVYDSTTKKITKIIDRFAKETLFQYSTNQVTITSPRGEVTTLNLNTNGMLSSIVNRNSETYNMTYTTQKQLATFQKPGGQVVTFTYDIDGNIAQDLGAGGDFLSFIRASGSTVDNQNISMSTARGINTSFVTTADETQANRSTVSSFGETITSVSIKGGTYSSTSSVGPQWTATRASDPRFPLEASHYPQDMRYQVSGSPIDIRNFVDKTVDVSAPFDPLAFTSMTTTSKLQNDNNRIFTSVYTAANKTLVRTSPLGRTSEVKFNSQGLLSEYKIGTLYPVALTYNAYGDLSQITQDNRVSQFAYDTYGNLASFTDVLGRVTNYTYDNSNRLTQYTLHNGAIGNFGYDANGNVTSVKPPGKTNHSFAYGLLELVTSYLPPSISSVVLGQETYEYNLDNQLTKVNKATGAAINLTYHATTGLLTQVSAPSGNIDLVYYANSDLVRYRTQTSGLNLEYGYIGKILNSVKSTGALVNQVNYTYNADASLAAIQVLGSNNASTSASMSYDRDGLLVEAGSTDYTRNHFNAVATVTNNLVQTTNAYNSFGEMSSATTKYQTLTRANFTYTRDKHSRVTAVAENILKVNNTYEAVSKAYTYDTVGRLETAVSGGVTTTYEYDNNGNRTKKITPALTITATYDEQDRLVQYGNLHYAYNSSGEKTSKTEKVDSNPANDLITQYFYNSYGFLTKVILPDAKVIEYLIDGQGRRVGRKVNGTLVEGYIYQSQTQIAAVTNGSGVVTKRFVYGEKINIPDLMITGGQEYRVVSDHIGTPRQVIRISTGAVDAKLNVDEFGNFISIEGTERLPFRFAGGLWDQDSKLLHFGARDYDPETGRWLSKDPIGFAGGDTNLYAYVGGDPMSYVDPSGLYTEVIGWTGVGTGSSSFGHISVIINGTSYSFGPGGLDMRSASDYLGLNSFRDGKGIILNLTSAQETSLANHLKNKSGSYSASSNNCGGPIQSGLSEQGILSGPSSILPANVMSSIANSSSAIGQTFYKAKPAIASPTSPWGSIPSQ